MAKLVEPCTGGRRVVSSRLTAGGVRSAVAQLVERCTGGRRVASSKFNAS